MTRVDLISAFAALVATREGYFYRGKFLTIPQRLHNPVDLRSWRDARGVPVPETNGFADFPECKIDGCKNNDHPSEAGWRAGRAQCSINIVKRGLTFYEFFAGKPGVYAGFANERDKNDPKAYAQFVCDGLCHKFGIDARCASARCRTCAGTDRVEHPRCINTVVYSLLQIGVAAYGG